MSVVFSRLLIDHNLIREWIRLVRRDGRNMIPLSIDRGDNLHHSPLQLFLHLPSIPLRVLLTSCTRQSDVYIPNLPYRLLVGFGHEPALAALLLKKLQREMAVSCFRLILW